MNPFTAVLIVVGLTEARSVIGGKGFTMQPVIGGFMLGGFLYVLTEVNPQFTSKLVTLVILTALLMNGAVIGKVFVTKKKTSNGKRESGIPNRSTKKLV